MNQRVISCQGLVGSSMIMLKQRENCLFACVPVVEGWEDDYEVIQKHIAILLLPKADHIMHVKKKNIRFRHYSPFACSFLNFGNFMHLYKSGCFRGYLILYLQPVSAPFVWSRCATRGTQGIFFEESCSSFRNTFHEIKKKI